MKQHLNTLFVTTQDAYLRKDGEAVTVRIANKDQLRVPLNNLGSIACFGRVACSPPLLGACAERGIGLTFLTEQGRFLAAVNGFTPGNVLLRREQYRRSDDLTASARIARACIIGKLANYRTVLRRAAREHPSNESAHVLTRAANRMSRALEDAGRGRGSLVDVVSDQDGPCPSLCSERQGERELIRDGEETTTELGGSLVSSGTSACSPRDSLVSAQALGPFSAT